MLYQSVMIKLYIALSCKIILSLSLRSPRLQRFNFRMSSENDIENCLIKAKIPLKIGVVGAGIGGVYLGYALATKGFDVTVFEKSAKFSRFGGPIQLASNALSCVNAMSPELFENIMGRFTFTGTRKCGIKDGMRNSWYSVFNAIKDLAEWNTLPYTGKELLLL